MIEIGNIKREIQQRKDREAKAKKKFLEKRAEKMNSWLYHIKTFLGKDFEVDMDDPKSPVAPDIDITIDGTDYRAIIRFNDNNVRFLPSKFNMENRDWITTSKQMIEDQVEWNVKKFMEWRMR